MLLHLGWDWERKGGDAFAEAVGRLRESGEEEIVALTVGADGCADGLRVIEPTDDVRTLFGAADVFVASSRSEGHPYAVMEALSCGTPVVASEIGSHWFVADRVESLRMAPVGDSVALAARITELLGRPRDEAERSARSDHYTVA